MIADHYAAPVEDDSESPYDEIAAIRHYPLADAFPAANTVPHFEHFICSVLTPQDLWWDRVAAG